jgi:hypothetical protein
MRRIYSIVSLCSFLLSGAFGASAHGGGNSSPEASNYAIFGPTPLGQSAIDEGRSAYVSGLSTQHVSARDRSHRRHIDPPNERF